MNTDRTQHAHKRSQGDVYMVHTVNTDTQMTRMKYSFMTNVLQHTKYMRGKTLSPVSVNMQQTSEVNGSTARSEAHKTNSLMIINTINAITTVYIFNKRMTIIMVTQSETQKTQNIVIVKKNIKMLLIVIHVGGAKRNTNTAAMKNTNIRILKRAKQNKLAYAE